MQEKPLILNAAEDEQSVVSTLIDRNWLKSTGARGWIPSVNPKVKNKAVEKDLKIERYPFSFVLTWGIIAYTVQPHLF